MRRGSSYWTPSGRHGAGRHDARVGCCVTARVAATAGVAVVRVTAGVIVVADAAPRRRLGGDGQALAEPAQVVRRSSADG